MVAFVAVVLAACNPSASTRTPAAAKVEAAPMPEVEAAPAAEPATAPVATPSPKPETPPRKTAAPASHGPTTTPRPHKHGSSNPNVALQESLRESIHLAWFDVLASCEALGIDPADPPALAFVTREELAEILMAENQPTLERLLGNRLRARTQARQFGRAMSQVVLAKLDNAQGRIVVQVENLLRSSWTTGRSDLLAPESLRALLLHELAHVADNRAVNFLEVLGRLESAEALEVFDALVEGHAQYVTRREAARRNWQLGFESYTAAITSPPAALDQVPALEQAFVELHLANMSARYNGGERFFEALYERYGSEAREIAFRRMPADMAEVLEPGWYLDPETRPKLIYDLAAGLETLAERIQAKRWVQRSGSINTALLRSLGELLPEADRSQFLRAARHNSMLAVSDPRNPGMQVGLGLYLADSEADAEALLLSLEKISRERDRRFETDLEGLRLAKADYTTKEEDGWREISVSKILVLEDESEVPVLLWFGRKGRLVGEGMDVAHVLGPSHLRTWTVAAAEAAIATGEEDPPADQDG